MRTLEQVTNEHNQVMFQIGIERYRMECSSKAIEKLLHDGLALNEEGAKLMKEKQENEAKSNGSNGSGNEQASNVEASDDNTKVTLDQQAEAPAAV